jgi:hypothetical protein
MSFCALCGSALYVVTPVRALVPMGARPDRVAVRDGADQAIAVDVEAGHRYPREIGGGDEA